MKERKLVLTKGRNGVSIQKVLKSALVALKKEFPEAEVRVGGCVHESYIDTYYDTETQTLRKNGESFKTRRGSGEGGKRYSQVVMRRKTKYPKKMEFSPWDIAEVTVPKLCFETAKSAMKPFFFEFDFDSISPNPVLICTTYRTALKIIVSQGEEEISFSICFDTLKYSQKLKEKEDHIIKIKTKRYKEEVIENVLKSLEEQYDQYKAISASRYERALEVLES